MWSKGDTNMRRRKERHPSEAVPSARNEEDRSVRLLEYGGCRVAEGQRGSRSRNDAHYHQIVIARLQLAQGHGD